MPARGPVPSGGPQGTPCCLPGTGPGSVEFPCESAPGHCCRTASERSRLETQRSGEELPPAVAVEEQPPAVAGLC